MSSSNCVMCMCLHVCAQCVSPVRMPSVCAMCSLGAQCVCQVHVPSACAVCSLGAQCVPNVHAQYVCHVFIGCPCACPVRSLSTGVFLISLKVQIEPRAFTLS